MTLVVDTNVIISALIRDSFTRRLILHPAMDLSTPYHVFLELERHRNLIIGKSDISHDEFALLLDRIMTNVKTVPESDIGPKLHEAFRIMEPINGEDTSFLALAMSIECDGLWSNDKGFQRQGRVRVWTTRELYAKMR